jgi:KaiC/GvpD/RAD55 family RecA-like ATPase
MLETEGQVDWTAIKEKVEVASGISVVSPDYVNYFEIDHEKRKKTGRRPIPTLISEELDVLMGGGVGIGEMALIEGIPGSGKTTFLINVGKGALQQGKRVLHISAEITEKVLRRRYDQALLECTFEQIRNADPSIFKRLDRLEKAGGVLIIKDMTNIRCKVGDIRSFLDSMNSKGLGFDVIIVDYADLLESSRSYKEKRHELDEIYRDLRRVANEFHSRMWSASQASKKSLDRKVAGLESLAEHWGKGGHVDFLMSWNETEDEHEEGFCRIFLAKNREGRINKTIRCCVDFDRMLIRGMDNETTNYRNRLRFDKLRSKLH